MGSECIRARRNSASETLGECCGILTSELGRCPPCASGNHRCSVTAPTTILPSEALTASTAGPARPSGSWHPHESSASCCGDPLDPPRLATSQPGYAPQTLSGRVRLGRHSLVTGEPAGRPRCTDHLFAVAGRSHRRAGCAPLISPTVHGSPWPESIRDGRTVVAIVGPGRDEAGLWVTVHRDPVPLAGEPGVVTPHRFPSQSGAV